MPSGPSCWRRITLGNLKTVFMLISSPSLKDEERTSNNAEPMIGNRGTNRPLQSAARHFPELGILPQVMKPRLTRTRVAPENPRKATEPSEGEVYNAMAERLMLPRLEKRTVVLIPSSWRGQILLQHLNNISSQRDMSGFVELCSADGNHIVVEIHLSHAQPQSFTHPHTRSVEEQQQGAKRSCGYQTRRTSLTSRHSVQQQSKLAAGVNVRNESLCVLWSCERHRNSIQLSTAVPVHEEVLQHTIFPPPRCRSCLRNIQEVFHFRRGNNLERPLAVTTGERAECDGWTLELLTCCLPLQHIPINCGRKLHSRPPRSKSATRRSCCR